MKRSISLVFLSLLPLFFHHCFFFQVDAYETIPRAGGNIKFKLIHRHSPELGEDTGTTLGLPTSPRERIKQLVHSDNARLHAISQKLAPRRKNFEVKILPSINMELPMRSAADIGTGQYFVSFRVGSPPKKFIMIVDTGSNLTWMKCKYKCNNCSVSDRAILHERIFHPNESLTFKPIPCSSDICKFDLAASFSLAHCPIPTAPCAYDYSYHDGTRVQGIFGNDTIKVRLSGGKKIELTDVMIGCSEQITGNFHDIDGVMGLGFDIHSFAVKAATKFRDKFSYCLVDHLSPSNQVNFLTFGGTSSPVSNMQYTKLILGVLNPFYAVNVSGISVNDIMLDIPSYLWDVKGDGGVIMDSGSSLTYLVKPVFDQVLAAFQAPLSKLKKLELNWGPDYCFSGEGFNESTMPKLAIHFADGAMLAPPMKSYVIDAADGVKCLGFASTGWPGTSVIGNIMQQNHLWEFDLLNSKLGFSPSSCN
ncbi:hypothetical protein REPUB_Repub12eG0051900 [Reevesia pubescens]